MNEALIKLMKPELDAAKNNALAKLTEATK
ncbi:hypothetical protein SAMN05216356_10489 [Oribacterium sp. WCC10]|nr:hypothetical protein SAMN05216356_10489 [Oribacterium sp. WCC10]